MNSAQAETFEVKDGPDFSKAQQVKVSGALNKHVLQAPFPELYTTMMYTPHAKQPIYNKDTKYVFILFGGTGARTKSHGIGATQSRTAIEVRSKLQKDTYVNGETHGLGSAVAFQNIINWGDYVVKDGQLVFVDDDARAAHIEKFANSKMQTEAMAADIRYVLSQIPTGPDGMPVVPVYLGTRSTSTLVAGQLSDNYIRQVPGADVFGKLTAWYGMGVVSHNEPTLSEDLARELVTLRHEDEKRMAKKQQWNVEHNRPINENLPESILDLPALKVQHQMFADMTWASDKVEIQPAYLNGRPHPKVWLFLSANDPMTPILTQDSVLQNYSRLHPEVEANGYMTVAGHNAAAAVQFNDREGQLREIQEMEIMRPFLRQLVNMPSLPRAAGSGPRYFHGGPELHHAVHCDVVMAVLKSKLQNSTL